MSEGTSNFAYNMVSFIQTFVSDLFIVCQNQKLYDNLLHQIPPKTKSGLLDADIVTAGDQVYDLIGLDVGQAVGALLLLLLLLAAGADKSVPGESRADH